jgi:hypothetical protein
VRFGVQGVRAAFPLLSERAVVPASELSGETHSVETVVTVLNDAALWTRERIADWVETVEAEAGL